MDEETSITIDKTAEFVIKHGNKFEQSLINKKSERYAFLLRGNIFHDDYLAKLEEYKCKLNIPPAPQGILQCSPQTITGNIEHNLEGANINISAQQPRKSRWSQPSNAEIPISPWGHWAVPPPPPPQFINYNTSPQYTNIHTNVPRLTENDISVGVMATILKQARRVFIYIYVYVYIYIYIYM